MASAYVEALLRKLEHSFTFSTEEKEALARMPMQIEYLRADQDIVRIGDRPTRSCLMLAGFAASYKMTGGGGRQITSFYVPGDIPDLQSLHLAMMDTGLATLTPTTVGYIAHRVIRDVSARFPNLGSALWRMSLVDASIFREWITNIGQRDALPRVAHLFCEMFTRLKTVGLTEDEHTCVLPISQVEFGEATGMSTVHVNRVLQELRAADLIQLSKNRLTIPDWHRLVEVADFDPAYLHLEPAVVP